MDEIYYREYTSKSEADKAINSLKGILKGISIDGVINDLEITELLLWCKKHKHLIHRNPFKEFMIAIEQIVSTSTNESRVEIVKDILWLSSKYEKKSIYYDQVTTEIQQLHGLCHGILADGKLNNKEIEGMYTWLKNNEHLSNYYPYDEIYTIVSSTLSDRIIEDDERLMLMSFFNDFIDLNSNKITKRIIEKTKDNSVKGICNYNVDWDFDNTNFCITGTCSKATKQEYRKRIEDLGGVWKKSMSGAVDYLIVGNEGSLAYAYSCYGRKIEMAINYRKKGNQIVIVHEFDFYDALEDFR